MAFLAQVGARECFGQAGTPPQSTFFSTAAEEAYSTYQLAGDGDLWPSCWADDGNMYAANGDGVAFTGESSRFDMAVSRIEGMPPALTGTTLATDVGTNWSGISYNRKPTGMLCVNDKVYLAFQNLNSSNFNDAPAASIAESSDHGATWTWDQSAPMFGAPGNNASPEAYKFTTIFFLDYGKNYGNAIDGYVYAYGLDNNWRSQQAMYLARVPKASVQTRSAWEFYTGTDAHGNPTWSEVITQKAPVLTDDRLLYPEMFGTDCPADNPVIAQGGVVYVAPLHRYLFSSWSCATHELYEAPEPWGPWSHFLSNDFGPLRLLTNRGQYGTSIPSKFISADGKTIYLQSNVCCGGDSYTFSLRRLYLQTYTPALPANSHSSANLALAPGTRAISKSTHLGLLCALNCTDQLSNGPLDASENDFDEQVKSVDWWGYTWPVPYSIDRVVYTAGPVFFDGGWYASDLRVQVRQNFEWVDVAGVTESPAYPYSDIAANQEYTFNFPLTWGDGVRIVGAPGGSHYFSSITALGVYYAGQSNAPAAKTPVFSVAAGTYDKPQSVKLSDATPGAQIYYTTNGTTPTTGSARYTAPILVSTKKTIEAIALAPGYQESAVATAAYAFQVATPTFSPAGGTYNAPQTVTIKDTTPGATIYYTTNGTAPTTSSTKYTGAIAVAKVEKIEAIAVATGYSNSAVTTASYAFQVATPTFSPVGGTYNAAQTVTIKDPTLGASIYYTTNGTTPTTSSTKFIGAISVKATETIQAIAVLAGYTNSRVATAKYKLVVATPTFTPAAGTYSSAQSVTIKDATTGAVIYYTTNGTTPTTSSTKYTVSIPVTATETIKAMAVLTGYLNSTVATAAYTITSPPVSPGGSNYGWYHLDSSCNREPYGVVYNYDTESTTINAQLKQMYLNGQRRLRIPIFHARGINSGTIMDSEGGSLSPRFQANLANLLAAIKAAGFVEVEVSFHPQAGNDPIQWTTFSNDYFLENWKVIQSLRPIIAAAGIPYHLDLLNEGIPPPGWTVLLQYSQMLWNDYVAKFGKGDTLGFSIISDAGHLSQVSAVYGASSYGNHGSPLLFDVHIYDETGNSFATAFNALNSQGYQGIGWIIGEAFYNDAPEAKSLRQEIDSTGQKVLYLTQWPLTIAETCNTAVNVAPPVNFSNYHSQSF